MRLGDQVQLTPVAYDTTAIQPYLAALDDPACPAADFRWRAPDDAVITADLKPEHILSVQISWDKGWKAYAADGASMPGAINWDRWWWSPGAAGPAPSN